MPPLLKLAKVLEESESTLKLAAAESVPNVSKDLLDLTVDNQNPNRISLSAFDRYEPYQMVRFMENSANHHVKKSKEFLSKDLALLLQIMLISEGVSPKVIPRIPSTDLDDKLLQLFGRCLIAEECEEDDDTNKTPEAKKTPEAAKKRKTPRVLKGIEEPESSSNAVAEWLRARGSVFGEHATSCVDRTIGLGTDLLFLKGMSRLTGGTLSYLENLMQETKELSDVLNNSSEIGGVESATANAKGNSNGEAKKK